VPAWGRGSGAVALLVVLLLILLFGSGPEDTGTGSGDPAGPATGESATADVLRVIDGDTIEVDLDGRTEDVRYIGVDTPETVKPGEPVQCFGPEASAFNHELVEDRVVHLEFDAELRDDYGRLLAYVFAGDRFVNAELVEGGYARTLEIEPNTSRAEQLSSLEDAAGAAGRGLWAAC
jgi:micrococcal nuclease